MWDAYTYDQGVAAGGTPEDFSTDSGVWSEYLVEIEPNLDENNSQTQFNSYTAILNVKTFSNPKLEI